MKLFSSLLFLTALLEWNAPAVLAESPGDNSAMQNTSADIEEPILLSTSGSFPMSVEGSRVVPHHAGLVDSTGLTTSLAIEDRDLQSSFADFCWRRSYGRGVGKVITDCPSHKDKIGALCYEKCPRNYYRWGFDCHRRGRIGIILGKPSPLICASGLENDAGLCYVPCRDHHTGVGPVCWNDIPEGFVGCGAGAATSTEECVSVVTNQVLSVAELAVFVVTFGGSSSLIPATATGKLAKFFLKWKKFKKVVSKYMEWICLGLDVINALIDLTELIKESFANGDLSPTDYIRMLADLTSIKDPTGVSSIISAYTYDTCDEYIAEAESNEEGLFEVKASRLGGKFVDVDVDMEGDVLWAVDSNSRVYKMNFSKRKWVQQDEDYVSLSSISVSSRGRPFGVRVGATTSLHYRSDGGNWNTVSNSPVTKTATSGDGSLVLGLDDDGQIHFTNNRGTNWHPLNQYALDVSINSDGSEIWMVDSNHYIFKRDGIAGFTSRIDGRLISVSLSDDGSKVWGVNINGNLYYKDFSSTLEGWTRVYLTNEHSKAIKVRVSGDGYFVVLLYEDGSVGYLTGSNIPYDGVNDDILDAEDLSDVSDDGGATIRGTVMDVLCTVFG